MRPLVVIALILVATATLLFSILFLGGEEEGGSNAIEAPSSQVNVIGPGSSSAPEPTQELEDGGRIAAPQAAAESRTALQSGSESFGNKLIVKVLDPDGQPVPGAKLTLERGTQRTGLAELQNMMGASNPGASFAKRSKSTNASGEATFRGIEPGSDYAVVATHDEYRKMRENYVRIAEEGEVNVTLNMQLGIIVHGYVHDFTGEPVEGAELFLESQLASALWNNPAVAATKQTSKPVLTNETGYYRISNVSPGEPMNLTVRANGLASKTRRNLTIRGEMVDVDFNLDPAQTVSGRVFGPDQKGIANASVRVMGWQQQQTMTALATTDSSGEFEIGNLAEGDYTLMASAEGWGVQRKHRIAAGESQIEIQMAEQGGVSGRAIDGTSGGPVTNFTVSLHKYTEPSNAFGRAIKEIRVADPEGKFELAGIEGDLYGVQISAAGFAPTYSEHFRVSQGMVTENIEVRLSKGGSLTGTVVEAGTGKPIFGALVSTQDNNHQKNPLTDLFGVSIPRKTTAKAVRTAKDGTFELPLLSAEVYQLRITHADYPDKVVNGLRVAEGAERDAGPIALTPGGTVRGTVYDEAGNPMMGASVTMVSTTSGDMRNYPTRTDQNGRYLLRNIAGGTYKIHATRDDGADDTNPFNVIIDMRNSERTLSVVGGQDYSQDLYLGNN